MTPPALVLFDSLGQSPIRKLYGAVLKGILRCASCEAGMAHTYTRKVPNQLYRCRERISQIMMLNGLAPDTQEAILRLPQTPGGRFHVGEAMLRSRTNYSGAPWSNRSQTVSR